MQIHGTSWQVTPIHCLQCVQKYTREFRSTPLNYEEQVVPPHLSLSASNVSECEGYGWLSVCSHRACKEKNANETGYLDAIFAFCCNLLSQRNLSRHTIQTRLSWSCGLILTFHPLFLASLNVDMKVAVHQWRGEEWGTESFQFDPFGLTFRTCPGQRLDEQLHY